MSSFRSFKISKGEYLTWGLSVVLAIFIWAYVDAKRVEERTIDIPLEVSVEKGWEIGARKPPKTIKVVAIGPKSLMGNLKVDQIKLSRIINIDKGTANTGRLSRNLPLRTSDVMGLPSDVTIQRIIPGEVNFEIVRVIRRYISVDVAFKGKPAPGHTVGSVVLNRHYIAVGAPEDQFGDNDQIKTVPIDLDSRSSFFRRTVSLQPLKLKDRIIPIDESVDVQVDMIEKKKQKIVEKVPVRILMASPMQNLGKITIEPAHVTLTIETRPDKLETVTSSALTVYIDTRDLGASSKDGQVLKCHAITPEGIKVVSIKPDEVRLKVGDK